MPELAASNDLPPRPTELVLRAEPRQALLEALRGEVRVTALTGLGGSGKTWLALDVAHELRETGFFRRVVWLSARDRPLALDDVLRGIARGLGRPDAAAWTLERLPPFLADLLADQAVLLVLDNLETFDRPTREDLLVFLSCLRGRVRVLATTREQGWASPPGGPEPPTRWIHLGGMSRLEAEQLLRQRADRAGALGLQTASPAALETMLASTGGLPIALRWIADQARTQPLRDILQSLRQGNDDLLGLLFERAWEALDPTSRQALRALAVLAGGASLRAICEVSGLSGETLASADGRLQRLALIERRGRLAAGDELLGLHPLTRDFVQARTPAEQRDELLGRAVQHYTALAMHHGGFLDQAGHGRLEPEAPTILALADWCYQRGDWERLLGLVRPLNNLFWLRGYWAERLRSGELARQAAAQLGDTWAEGEILSGDLGWTCLQLGQLDAAWEYLDRARVLLAEAENHSELSSAWRYLAQIARRRGDPTTAHKLLGLAIETARQVDNPGLARHTETRALVDLGYLHLAGGEHDLAEAKLQTAAERFQSVGDELRRTFALNGLGDLALARGEPASAQALYQASLEVAERHRSLADQARALLRLGQLAASTGHPADARQRATEARDLFRQLALQAEAEASEALLQSLPTHRDWLRIDPAGERVWLGEREVKLSAQELEFLQLLLARLDQLCSYAEIRQHLWPDSQTPATTMHSWIHRLAFNLRRKLEAGSQQPFILVSVHGKGYRLTPPNPANPPSGTRNSPGV